MVFNRLVFRIFYCAIQHAQTNVSYAKIAKIPDECGALADKRFYPAKYRMKIVLQSGLSLLEILILLAVVIGLAAYFFPGVEAKRQAQRRVQAQTALVNLADALDSFKARTGSYSGAAGIEAEPQREGTPWIVPADVPGGGARTQYRLRIAYANEFGYEVRAVPVGDQIQDPCGTLTLTAKRVRGMLNAQSDWRRADCWTINTEIAAPGNQDK